MQCPSCGQPVDSASRFCPQCGAPLPEPAQSSAVPPSYGPAYGAVPPPYSASGSYDPPRPTLSRPRSGRMVAGVCAAFARTYGWNVILIRILLVVLVPLHLGLGFLAYLVGWIAIPEDPIVLPPAGRA